MELTRREVNLGAAWAVPAILVAVAAPAAVGSQPPPEPVCVDPAGLVIEPAEGTEWKTNSGDGFTTVKGDSILIGNDGPYNTITVLITVWTSSHQEGLRLVGNSGDTFLEIDKDGNKASIELDVTLGVDRLLRVVAPEKDAEAHIIVGCSRGFILKSSR